MRKLQNHSGYLDELDTEIASFKVEQSFKTLRGFSCEAIAFTGMSGAIMAPMIAARLGVPLILVRKPFDNSHSGRRVEGAYDADTYLIVDDFISSGDTVRNIVQEILAVNAKARCVGVYSYRYNNLYTPERPQIYCLEEIWKSASKPRASCAFTGFPTIDDDESNMISGKNV